MKVKAVLNPDKEAIKEIILVLKEASGFCPCTLIRDNPDYKCKCKTFRDMLTEEHIGELYHCGLYKIIGEDDED